MVLMRALDKRSALERAAIEWLVPVIVRNIDRILAEPVTPELLAQIDRETLYAYFAHLDVVVTALEFLEEVLAEDDLGAQIPAIGKYLSGSGTEELADWALRLVDLLRSSMGALVKDVAPAEVVAQVSEIDLESVLRSPASAIFRVQFLALALVEAVARQVPVERAAEIAVHVFLAADKVRVVFGVLGTDLDPDHMLQPAERGARALALAGMLARSLSPDDIAGITEARLGPWSLR